MDDSYGHRPSSRRVIRLTRLTPRRCWPRTTPCRASLGRAMPPAFHFYNGSLTVPPISGESSGCSKESCAGGRSPRFWAPFSPALAGWSAAAMERRLGRDSRTPIRLCKSAMTARWPGQLSPAEFRDSPRSGLVQCPPPWYATTPPAMPAFFQRL